MLEKAEGCHGSFAAEICSLVTWSWKDLMPQALCVSSSVRKCMRVVVSNINIQ